MVTSVHSGELASEARFKFNLASSSAPAQAAGVVPSLRLRARTTRSRSRPPGLRVLLRPPINRGRSPVPVPDFPERSPVPVRVSVDVKRARALNATGIHQVLDPIDSHRRHDTTRWLPFQANEARSLRGRPPQGPVVILMLIVARGCFKQYLLPVHPLFSFRRSQGRGVSCPIVLPTCQLLGPTVPYPVISAVRSRRPAASEFASESHLRWLSSRNIGACRSPDHPSRGTRAP